MHPTAPAPLVSVVVIGRNEGRMLLRALESVRVAARVSAQPTEIIYVDSASTDGSAERARRVSAVHVVPVYDRSTNAAYARNVGISVARGTYVQFLDGDMEIEASWLPCALQAIRASGCAAVGGKLAERRLRATIWNRAFGNDWRQPAGPTRVLGGAALWRRDVLVELGGFDTTLRVGEDPDLSLRACRAHHELRIIDEPMARHDLDLRSFGDYLRRARAVGHSIANVAWHHPDSEFAARRIHRLTLWIALFLCAVAACAVSWPWGFVSVTAVGLLLLLRRFLGDRLAGLSTVDAAVHALHVYAVKLPVAWSVFGRLHELRRDGRSA